MRQRARNEVREMRRFVLIFILLVSLVSLDASAISPGQQLAVIPMTFETTSGVATTTLVASNDTYAPGDQGYIISQYEYIGFAIMLDDASASAIDVDVNIQVSPNGTNFEEYTQTCIYPAIEAATATLNIDDEDLHTGSIHIAPTYIIRIVFDNNNADTDVTPTMWLLLQ